MTTQPKGEKAGSCTCNDADTHRLLMAAPDLLEAAYAVIHHFVIEDKVSGPISLVNRRATIERVRAAIAKAEGVLS